MKRKTHTEKQGEKHRFIGCCQLKHQEKIAALKAALESGSRTGDKSKEPSSVTPSAISNSAASTPPVMAVQIAIKKENPKKSQHLVCQWHKTRQRLRDFFKSLFNHFKRR